VECGAVRGWLNFGGGSHITEVYTPDAREVIPTRGAKTMTTATMQEVDVRQKVFTAEELKALRARLAGGTVAGGTPNVVAPEEPSGQEPDDWDTDIAMIVKFLTALADIMQFLCTDRIAGPSKGIVQSVLNHANSGRQNAIEQLQSITSADDLVYRELKEEGLTGNNLLAKLSSFIDDIDGGSVAAVLDGGDKVVGSLAKVIPTLGVFKEAKELVEHKVKYHGDAALIALNIYGPKEKTD
jgi:hypothetical protein